MAAIEIRDLSKNYKDKKAVDSLSLTVEEGELFALLGVNGAGKTTTIKMLSCISKPSGGDALIMGRSIIDEPLSVKEIINVSPQETAVAPMLTVRENLELICGIHGFSKQQSKEKTDKIIDEFSLSEIEKSKAKTLSGGWQRRLSIAMAIITEPRVLFLDEPTLGLDVLARRELWKMIEKLKSSMTIILTTHYLEEAQSLSDRIAIMAKGRLSAVGTAQELMELSGKSSLEDAFVALCEEGEK
ncbi:MAG: ABC transporter ATP-binding protein [Ruminococcaceae bacterium]|nr:ABC transporter ATP-binding protein [Oscillospiraceae bacterium]